MCGIVGFAKRDCLKDIYNGLLRLEYRGYDSAGLAYFNNGEIKVIKKAGRVQTLAPLLPSTVCSVGIGHTRWATHGSPTDENAHPHCSKRFAVVHNGIIENYLPLKKELQAKGYPFLSQTDTEVIVQLLEDLFDGDMISTLRKLRERLEGSYALAILFLDTPSAVYLLKRENPLILGKGEGFTCFASDTPAIIRHTDLIYKMRDGETAILTQNKIRVFGAKGEKHIRFVRSTLSAEALELGRYSSYMEKEIHEVPIAITATMKELKEKVFSDKAQNALKTCERVYFVGCGSAYHACLYAARLFKEELGIYAAAETAGEFRYSKAALSDACLVVAVSQSGETADTIGAAKRAKQAGKRVIAITNVPQSSISLYADECLLTLAQAEIAVAATKSYCAQLAALYVLAQECARLRNLPFPRLNVARLCAEARRLIQENENAFAFLKDKKIENLFFIGRSYDYATALEGALKVKEIAYLPSDACPAAEIKHGPLAMVSENTLLVCIVTVKRLKRKMLNAIHEAASRGATTVAITAYDLGLENQIRLPVAPEQCLPLLSVLPLQLLALFLAQKKGLDPDKPRHLAKSVTVE